MFCNKCGTEFLGVEACPNCGHAAVKMPVKPQPVMPELQPITVSPASVTDKSDKAIFVLKIIICALGMAMGLLAILNVIVPGALFGLYAYDYYSWYDPVTFGADFYTEIHDAVSNCIWGIGNVNESIVEATNIAQILAGSGFFLGFGFKLLTVMENRKNKN